MSGKTVYILGAGASKTANLPIQAEILPLIFSISLRDRDATSGADDFLSIDLNVTAEKVRDFYPVFDAYRQELGKFIVASFSTMDKYNQFLMAIEYAKNLKKTDVKAINQCEEFLFKAYDIAKNVNVSLEDLFTIIDRVTAGREHFRLFSPQNMVEIHAKLKLCVIYALAYSSSIYCDDLQYRRFSQLLINTRLTAPQKEDTPTVITLNWDNVLERVLYSMCDTYNSKKHKGNQRVSLDLCFNYYMLGLDSDNMPSTNIKARGPKSIKILKMHGSLSWLECPRCRRIYSDFSREIAVDEYADKRCPHCKTSDILSDGDPILQNLIITPTFLKSFDNLNIKNIWHNAYIEISKAEQLIFIGYSFPDADFEMRCLLKKAIKSSAHITVVLNSSNNPQIYADSFAAKGYSINEIQQFLNRMQLPEGRYKSFFGEDKITFNYQGFQNYLDEVGGKV